MNFLESPITFILMGLNVVFSIIGFTNSDFKSKMIGWPYYEKNNKEYYRFLTSGFLHADWMHLIFNMFTLYSFGRNIEIIFDAGKLGGNIAYLALYFSGLIISSIPSFLKHKDNKNYCSLGASGAVSAVLFASIIFSPWTEIYVYFIKASAILFTIIYLVYSVYMSRNGGDNVNHDAHSWGALFGIAFTVILIATLRSDLYPHIVEDLKNPSIFGTRDLSSTLKCIFSTQ